VRFPPKKGFANSSFDMTDAPRVLGQVRFFGLKGYGFITPLEGDRTGTDIFVHHTAIQGAHRTLRGGEIVEFEVHESSDRNVPADRKTNAAKVTGVRGAPLMAEFFGTKIKHARHVEKICSE
jgi:cold shock CspA family protein